MSSIPKAELKRRYETGDKMTKPARKAIAEELKRKCSKWGCGESLAFERSDRTVCRNSHRKKGIGKLAQRKANREKKKRYYEKHGIKFNKTIRKRDYEVPEKALSEGNAQTYAGQTLLYENYKEPLKKIEKGKGYGFYGTVALTEDREYVQCHICGHLFRSVGHHLRVHKIDAEKYKETYGLKATAALMNEPMRLAIQKRSIGKFNGTLPDHLKEYNRKVQSGEVKHIGTKRREGGMSLQKRNEVGLCPDQVLEKIRELADKLGRTPSELEFTRHYDYKYLGSIKFQHGSYLKAVAKLGLKSAKELKEPDNEDLLQDLVDFQEKFKRIPTRSDFNRGLVGRPYAMYWRRFGSINNARIEAGLNAVVPMGFGQMVEMTPDEYFAYKSGHGISDSAKRHRSLRKRRKEVSLR